jgi:hypothetical protein
VLVSQNRLFGQAIIVAGVMSATSFTVITTATAMATASVSRTASPGHSARYVHYKNARFGFSLSRPASFKAEPKPEDGDGRGWQRDHGRVDISGFGQNNVLDRTPKDDEKADSQGLHVTYHNISGRVVTVSGYRHHRHVIVYQRDVVGKGSIDTLFWTYPTSQRKRWKRAVKHTVHSYRAGRVADGH